MRTLALVLGICVLSLAMTGCALTNYTIDAPYDHAQFDAASSEPVDVVWEKLELKPTIAGMPGAVGVKKNGFNMDTAYVYMRAGPEAWLTAAAHTEFSAANVNIRADAPDAPRVAIVVDQFFVEPAVGFWGADMTALTVLDVTVTMPLDGSVYQRRFVGDATTFEMAWPDSDFEERLIESAQTAMYQVAHAIRTLALDGEVKR